MSRISASVPSLIQGISQQPDALRFPSQAELQENAWPSVVDGLTKRHPFDAIGKLADGGGGDPLVHFINRDPLERYVLDLNHERVRVYELTGAEVPVYGPSGAAADFSYLDLTTADDIPGSSTFAVADGWLVNSDFGGAYGTAAVPTADVGPLGVGVWQRLSTGAFFPVGQRNTFQLGFFTAEPQTFSVYLKRDTEVAMVRLNSEFINLRIDEAGVLEHYATFQWQPDGSLAVYSETGGARGSVVEQYGNAWRASVTFQPGTAGSGATAVGAPRRVGIETVDISNTEDRTVLAYGARLDVASEAGDYFNRPSRYLKALTIADYSLVLNTTPVAAMAGATTAADPNARKAFLFVRGTDYKTNYNVNLQRSGGSLNVVQHSTWDGNTSGNVKNKYTLQITAAGTAATVWSVTILGLTATYTVQPGDTTNLVAAGLKLSIDALANVSATVFGPTITITGDYEGQAISPSVTPATGGTYVLTQTQAATAVEGNSIKTDDIATALATKIGTLSGFTATAVGSVVKIESTTDIAVLDVSDSRGNDYLVKIHKTVKVVSDLPLICEHDFKVAIVGETNDTADDYYTKFAADDGSGFGNGKWVESNGHAILTTIDSASMPHQLVRKQDDVSGTITGTPYAKYFEWSPATWTDRLVGDDNSSPVPSLIGQQIRDLFFFRNRLGMLAGQNVVMSEIGLYFNLFRTTVLTLPDSDPIDIAVPHTSVVTLNHAVPFNDTLVLFSDFTQFEVTGDPVLAPRTVQASAKMDYDNLRFCRPLATERGVFFGAARGEFTSVLEMKPDQTSNTGGYVADPVSAAVPKYVAGKAFQFAASSLENVLFIATDGEQESLFVYNYFTQETQKLQSAWHKYPIGAKVLGLGFFETSLYIVLQHDNEVWLERSIITSGRVDDGSDHLTLLDRRIKAGPNTTVLGTYDLGTNTTTWTVPYTPDDGEVIQVVTDAGEVIEASHEGTTVTVDGDRSAEEVWVGVQYVMRYQFSRPRLRTTEGNAKVPILSGKYRLQFGLISYTDSAFFTVKITPKARAPLYATFDSLLLQDAELGSLNLASGTFRFGIQSRADTTEIEVINDSPMPCKLENCEWEADYTAKARRFQG